MDPIMYVLPEHILLVRPLSSAATKLRDATFETGNLVIYITRTASSLLGCGVPKILSVSVQAP